MKIYRKNGVGKIIEFVGRKNIIKCVKLNRLENIFDVKSLDSIIIHAISSDSCVSLVFVVVIVVVIGIVVVVVVVVEQRWQAVATRSSDRVETLVVARFRRRRPGGRVEPQRGSHQPDRVGRGPSRERR